MYTDAPRLLEILPELLVDHIFTWVEICVKPKLRTTGILLDVKWMQKIPAPVDVYLW